MMPTLQSGSLILITNPTFKKPLKKKEVIVFQSSNNKNFLVKRIYAIPGDKLLVFNDNTLVLSDNKKLKENLLIIFDTPSGYLSKKINLFNPYKGNQQLFWNQISWLYAQQIQPFSSRLGFTTICIPDHYFYVLGDNIQQSVDSRVYGMINNRRIKGRLIWDNN